MSTAPGCALAIHISPVAGGVVDGGKFALAWRLSTLEPGPYLLCSSFECKMFANLDIPYLDHGEPLIWFMSKKSIPAFGAKRLCPFEVTLMMRTAPGAASAAVRSKRGRRISVSSQWLR